MRWVRVTASTGLPSTSRSPWPEYGLAGIVGHVVNVYSSLVNVMPTAYEVYWVEVDLTAGRIMLFLAKFLRKWKTSCNVVDEKPPAFGADLEMEEI